MYWPNCHYGMESLVIVIVRTVACCLSIRLLVAVVTVDRLLTIVNHSVTNNAWRLTGDYFSLQVLLISRSL